MSVAPARPASTVVLLRPSASRFEVFLVRRHDNVAFMGGAHVFPGGRVNDADSFLGEDVSHHVAAVRELFEEAGILLARRADGRLIEFSNQLEAARYHAYRTALENQSINMGEVVAREEIQLALDGLAWFAHWVTPEIEIKRFDTRFFLTTLPAGQEAAHDQTETTHGEWMDPADAIDRCRRDDIALPPPTWTTLRTLSQFATARDAMAWARARRVVRVQPAFLKNERMTMLTLPGDPTYPAIEGFETPAETRFILADGRWRPVSPN